MSTVAIPEAPVVERVTDLFPTRIPEPAEAMSAEESAAFAAFTATPIGRGLYAGLAAHVARRLGLTRGRIVSLGEGEGRFASELARRLPGASVVGTDICPEAVARASERHRAPNLSFALASATDVERLGPFDAVVSVQAFHHFEEPGAILASARRSLAPGGAIYVQDLRRDATRDAYLSVLDGYVAANAWIVARLFRASMHAAYAPGELARLFAPLGGHVEVEPVRFGPASADAFRREDPDHARTLPVVLGNVAGLWMDALWREG